MSDTLILVHTAIVTLLIVVFIMVLRLRPVIALVLGSIYLDLAAGLGFQKAIAKHAGR